MAGTDLTIQGTSPLEEMESQSIGWLTTQFSNENVEVAPYFDELTLENTQELVARATGKTLVLFDVTQVQPEIDEVKQYSHERTQREEVSFGFLIVYASLRDDDGQERKHNAFRVIERIRKELAGKNFTITVSPGGDTNTFTFKLREISRLRQPPPGVAVYQMIYTTRFTRQFV